MPHNVEEAVSLQCRLDRLDELIALGVIQRQVHGQDVGPFKLRFGCWRGRLPFWDNVLRCRRRWQSLGDGRGGGHLRLREFLCVIGVLLRLILSLGCRQRSATISPSFGMLIAIRTRARARHPKWIQDT